jgi:hypothetical protein
MPISSGTKLGHYEILSPIGAGGMGEVFRARVERGYCAGLTLEANEVTALRKRCLQPRYRSVVCTETRFPAHGSGDH